MKEKCLCSCTYPPFGEKSTKMTPGVSSFAMILNGLDPSALSEPERIGNQKEPPRIREERP